MIARRRLLLMRHGAVEYFDPAGRPYPPDDVPLTSAGIEQAHAMGVAIARASLTIDRAITSGLARTRQTAEKVLAAASLSPPVEHWPDLREIQPGHLPSISDRDLQTAFLSAFAGPVPRETRFLQGETIGALLDRTLPALQRLLADADWDTTLMVLHGGVNRGLLSWFLTGQPVFLGGLAQDTGCLNIVDVGTGPANSVVRVVNFCPIDTLQTGTRLSTMEHLLEKYLKLRTSRGDLGDLA